MDLLSTRVLRLRFACSCSVEVHRSAHRQQTSRFPALNGWNVHPSRMGAVRSFRLNPRRHLPLKRWMFS
jgi:hypothetical protein